MHRHARPNAFTHMLTPSVMPEGTKHQTAIKVSEGEQAALTAISCLKSLLLQRSLDRSGDLALWLVIMTCISIWYRLFACSTASTERCS